MALQGCHATFPPTCCASPPGSTHTSAQHRKHWTHYLLPNPTPLHRPLHPLSSFFLFIITPFPQSARPQSLVLFLFLSPPSPIIHALHGCLYPSYPFHSPCHHPGWDSNVFFSLGYNNSCLVSLYHFSLIPWLHASLLTDLKLLNIAYSSQQTFIANLIMHNITTHTYKTLSVFKDTDKWIWCKS